MRLVWMNIVEQEVTYDNMVHAHCMLVT